MARVQHAPVSTPPQRAKRPTAYAPTASSSVNGVAIMHEGASVAQAGPPAKNPGGRPERTIAISESVIFDLVLATQQAEEAIVKLHRARAAFIADANRNKIERRAA